MAVCVFWQDVTEEDIESELAVIHSQMAYVMQLQGRTDEALQLYNQVIKLKYVAPKQTTETRMKRSLV